MPLLRQGFGERVRLRRAPPPPLDQDGFNMTPMIDIVFQLIIFFMLVTDMAQARLDPVTLPAASTASVVKYEDDLVVNVTAEGRVRVSGKTVSDDALEAMFELRRPKAERGMGYPVVIRADRSTPFEHVQKVMSIATVRGLVTRVQFSARKE